MKHTVKIQNLKCGGCANTIMTRLNELEGVYDVSVDNDEQSVTFNHTDANVLESTYDLLSKLGYPIVGDPNTITKKAKSYVSCALGRLNN